VWQCAGTGDCANFYPTVDGGGSPVVCCAVAGRTRITPAGTNDGCLEAQGLSSITCMAAADCAGPVTVGAYTYYNYIACQQQGDCIATSANGNDGGTCTPLYVINTPMGLCL
jgi:hypothetical protein